MTPNQPKLAGEWTFRDVNRDNHYSIWQGDTCIAQDVPWRILNEIIIAHNAALAAEREKVSLAVEEWAKDKLPLAEAAKQHIKHLESQLADQPKPTGEWTADHVRCVVDETGWQGLADRINAALAAERDYAEARRNEIYEAWKRELADDRVKSNIRLVEVITQRDHYKEQLAKLKGQ
jgi:hypothetical protein